MKHIKTYEEIDNNPKVDDYVVVDSSQFGDLKYFLDTEIGIIDSINIAELKNNGYPYIVKFNKIIPASSFGPSGEHELALRKKEMLAWSNNLDELKIIIDTKKYNL